MKVQRQTYSLSVSWVTCKQIKINYRNEDFLMYNYDIKNTHLKPKFFRIISNVNIS